MDEPAPTGWYEIREPSGDQAGFTPCGINLVNPEPSTPTTHIPPS